MPEDKSLRGIDGWLLVFLAGCVVTSLYYLVLLGFNRLIMDWRAHDYGETLPPMILAEDIVYELLRIALPLVIMWRMIVARRWRTIGLAIALIWLLFLGLPLGAFGLVIAQTGWPHATLTIGFFLKSTRAGVLVAMVATLYLLGSRRVAATYPRGLHLDEVFD